jgi:hypothetical protein
MIENTIAKIEERLRTDDSLPPEKRLELEQLLAELRRESSALPSLARRNSDESDIDLRAAVDRLGTSLTEFEASHPQLVALVNRISTVLANMGI